MNREVPRSLRLFLGNFHPVRPRFVATQEDALEWLAQANAKAQGTSPLRMRKEAQRFGCGPDRIGRRGHELEDFVHLEWGRMRIFNLERHRGGAGLEERTRFFSEAALDALTRLYPEPARNSPPDALIHVTCTGYASPSAAQRWVAQMGWGEQTEVFHVYHMGCYAALPAVRASAGWMSPNEGNGVDLVHTELCTLHLDLERRTPENWVVQSLFGDGLIRYRAKPRLNPGERALEVIAMRDRVLPGSSEMMRWWTSDRRMEIVLGREVPERISEALEPALSALTGGQDRLRELKRTALWAIHPGGPRIVDQIQQLLGLEDSQVMLSRKVLFENGNMSSATLPHVWAEILDDAKVDDGTDVVSLAFGPGLTISGALMRIRGSKCGR